MDELKRAIVEIERTAHEIEEETEDLWASGERSDAEYYDRIAGYYRIAAACCGEKLERMEADRDAAQPCAARI